MAQPLTNSPSSAPVILGRTEPRVFTPPLRELTPDTSLGYECIEFAEEFLGEKLLPWQKWLLIHALELNEDGNFRFRTVIVLVARQNGKTHLLRVLALWRMFVDAAEVLGAAQNLAMAKDTWRSACLATQGSRQLRPYFKRMSTMGGNEELELTNGARYRIVAGNGKAPRGKFGIDLLIFDELREQKDWNAWNALEATTSAKSNGQTFCLSNAGGEESVVLNFQQDRAVHAIASGETADTSVGLFEWSAPLGVELDDVEAWAMANPALGYTIQPRVIKTALENGTADGFRTERLCIRVPTLSGAIDMGAWRDGYDPTGTLNAVRDRIVLCLDISPTNMHATLCAAVHLPDGRVRVGVVMAWSGKATMNDVRRDLPEIIGKLKPRVLGWFPNGPAAAIAADIKGVRKAEAIKATEVTQACMGFAEQVTARRILHNGDALLAAHAKAAEKMPSGDGWKFRRKAEDIDAVYSAAGAVHLARMQPALGKPRIIAV